MSDLEFSIQIRISSFQIALENACTNSLFMNYTELRRENLPYILDFFGLEVSGQEFRRMTEQFRYHSKQDDQQVTFISDSEEKQANVTDEMRRLIQKELSELYTALQESDRNITSLYSANGESV